MFRILRSRYGSRLIVALACLAMLLFGVMPSGTHAPKLHSYSQAGLTDVHQGDHTHDHDWDLDQNEIDRASHHHPDHTHEKADLVFVASEIVENPFGSYFALPHATRLTGRLYGIDRPPRFVNLA